MWGIAANPEDAYVGFPWLMGTDRIRENVGHFLWMSRHYDKIMSKYFNLLCNLVDAEYAEALRWLKWLGFTNAPPIKTKMGFDFIPMYKDTSHVR